MSLRVIDIFAGPGGLGEGFSALTYKNGERRFKVSLSIEKELYAYQTLLLRSFYRQFTFGNVSKKYYDFVKGKISLDELFRERSIESNKAAEEAWHTELCKEAEQNVDNKITQALDGEKKWVLVGGPPCQAYSIVGRVRNNGINPNDPRVYLYREYYRILAVHNPPVFVMENVKGLLSAKIDKNNIFRQIINDLSDPVQAYGLLNGAGNKKFNCPGYKIYSLVCKPLGFELDGTPVFRNRDFIIKAEDYGIPQSRHRIILLGIRKDLEIIPGILKKRRDLVPLNEVIKELPPMRSIISRSKDSTEKWEKEIKEVVNHPFLKEISDKHATYIKTLVKNIDASEYETGSYISSRKIDAKHIPAWFLDNRLGGICNHEPRAHMISDLYRYLFVSSFANIYKRSPKLSDFPPSLLPKHKNVNQGVKENKFADRFRVHLWNEPAKTITSHIHKDGHYYIHPDPSQCRSFTVREAARIQTFPDNYIFCGSRTSQYIQVGNAVPPFLAYQIAQIVSDVFNKIENANELNGIKEHSKIELEIINY